MALEKYHAKRKFDVTTEPPALVKNASKNRFVVQEHHASHLHYDFRLELPEHIDSGDIVLKSWAVPKMPPLTPGEKRLAVEVEDHPVDYIKFHGIIPEGEYGAGTVKIWDSGKFELIRRTSKEYEIVLHGQMLRGRFVLLQTGFGGNKKNWLLIAEGVKKAS